MPDTSAAKSSSPESPVPPRPTMGFVRGYFAGWSDARSGHEYGGTRAAGWDIWPPGDDDTTICGVVAPNQGPAGEPLACAWPDGHLTEGTSHSWAWVPTVLPPGGAE